MQVGGEPRLCLRDPLQLSDRIALVPPTLAQLLPLLDGTRDAAAVAALAGQQRPDVRDAVTPETVELLVRQLDEALLLESPRYARAVAAARRSFRTQPFRRPALAGPSYPADARALERLLDGYAAAPPPVDLAPLGPIARAAGVLSPHIDYARGGPVYGATWAPVVPSLVECEAVVVFGTDHWGSAGALTVTPQRYATPWGTLPGDPAVVDALCRSLGESAVAEELHHQREHAIELAVVWLHWALRRAGRASHPPAVVAILCGSFHCYTRAGSESAAAAASAQSAALDALAAALHGRRVLVVSAADLAHVGPAFGDPAPLGEAERRRLAAGDAALLGAITAGGADAVLESVRHNEDRTRVCGLPPTYWAMRLLERLRGAPAPGRLTAYAQCPADEAFGSVVSIAGALWE
jgi:MEMO1 family protein